MNNAFECVVNSIINRFKERETLSSQPIGMWFEKNLCRTTTNLIDIPQIAYDSLLDGELDTLSRLNNETYFNASYFSSEALCALFWAFQKTVLDHWDLFTRTNSFEETQNASLFANLSSNLNLLSCLDESIEASGDFFLYSADCKSDSTESRLGTDFGIIVPVADDRYKVALFQAKKANFNTPTSIERQSPGNSHYQQLTRMLDIETAWGSIENIDQSDVVTEYKGSLLGALCFYVFWHAPESYLLPTILSAIQANHQIEEKTGVSYFGIGSVGSSVPKSAMEIVPLRGGSWFSEAISLLLADPETNFGITMTKEEICALLASETAKPRQILGVRIPSATLNLGDWRDIIPENLVENEKFFLKEKTYNSRKELDLANPRDKKRSSGDPAP